MAGGLLTADDATTSALHTQTDRHMHRYSNKRHTDTDRQTDRQTDIQYLMMPQRQPYTYRQTDRQTYYCMDTMSATNHSNSAATDGCYDQMHNYPVNESQSELKRPLAADCGVLNDEEPMSISKFDPVVLLAVGVGTTQLVPGCCDDCGDGWGNFTPGATLVPAPGGGGNSTAAVDAAEVPRDRGLTDVGAGASDPSADLLA